MKTNPFTMHELESLESSFEEDFEFPDYLDEYGDDVCELYDDSEELYEDD